MRLIFKASMLEYKKYKPIIICAYEHYENDSKNIKKLVLNNFANYSIKDHKERKLLYFFPK